MKDSEIREIFEVNLDTLKIPDAKWHEDEQRYTVFSQKQFAWTVFKAGFYIGALYGRD